MKKALICTILATTVINVLFPLICYQLFGIFYVFNPFETKYLIYSSIIILFVLFVLFVLVKLSIRGTSKYEIEDLFESILLNGKTTERLFLIAIVLSITKQIMSGGFSGIISGAGNGGLISYVQLFFNIHLLHFLVLLKAYREKNIKKIIILELLYLTVTLFGASRSGIFWIVFFNLIIISALRISREIKRKILMLSVLAILVSPVIFAFSTNAREKASQATNAIARIIVARLSYLEVASIEIDQYLNDSYQKEVFQEKYGIDNQIKQSINSIVPGDLFEYDVQPNQYWRTVFLGWSVEGSQSNYTSIYMILPLYFILKYGLVLGITFCIVFIYSLYRFFARIKDCSISIFCSCFFFYTFFQYFDWVYHFQDVMGVLLTLLLIKALNGELVIGRIRFVIGPRKSVFIK